MEDTVVKGYKVFHSDWKCNAKEPIIKSDAEKFKEKVLRGRKH